MDILQETIRMVRASDESLVALCRAAGVTPRWFYMVEKGAIKDPSIRKIMRLRQAAEAKAA